MQTLSRIIQEFIKLNYQDMYIKWSLFSKTGYYGDNE